MEEVPMSTANRKPYNHRFNLLSGWTLKAIGLVIAGAAMVLIAVTISKAVSLKSESSAGGKFVGVRHDATTIPGTARAHTAVRTSSADQDLAAASASNAQQEQQGPIDTVIQNGITIVSPRLLVPIIDIDALQADAADDSNSSSKQRRGHHANRSHSHRHVRIAANRWPAYGSTIR
jgi:hypothetical protein